MTTNISIPTKICTKCGWVKELSEFHKDNQKQDGLRPDCKECKKTQYRSLDGKLHHIYRTQVRSSKQRGQQPPNYTKSELLDKYIDDILYIKLYKAWVKSGYNIYLAPSLDRFDDYKPYTFNNMRLGTYLKNRENHYEDVKSGIDTRNSKSVSGTCLKTGNKTIYHSQHEAARQIGVFQSSISQCCRGRLKSVGNYTWEYI